MTARAGVLTRLLSRRSNGLIALTTTALCASALVALPTNHSTAHAATAAANPPPPTASQPSQLVPSAHGDIAAMRTATTQTFPLGNGQYQAHLYSTPVNYQATDKTWQPIDTTLVPSGTTGYKTAAGDITAFLPKDLATGPVTVTAAGRTFGVQLVGAAGAGTVSGSTETWAGALPGVTVALTDGTTGVKETLTLASAAAQHTFSYTLTLPAGVTPAITADGGVALTAGGTTLGTLPAAFMDDASRTAAGHSTDVPYTLIQTGASTWTLGVTPDAGWLANAARVWPVVIDPTVWITGAGYLACGIVSSTPTTAHCPDTTFGIGTNGGTYRALAKWPTLTTAVPLDSVVTEADFYPYATSALNGTTQTVNVYDLNRTFTSAATWNTYDGTNAWTTPGGDFGSVYGYANLVPGTGARQVIPMTSLVGRWISGAETQNGILIKVQTEPGSNVDSFASSSDPVNGPELRVTYQARFGQAGAYNFTKIQFADRQSLSVNNANGNLVLNASDLNLSSVGMSTSIAHTYNSRRSDQPSTLGYGWVYDTGRDVRAFLDAANNVTYLAPGGAIYIFGANGSNFNDAIGANASVTYASGKVTLTDHQSKEVDVFNTDGTLHTRTDRNGNVQTMNYNASIFTGDGLPYLDSITDTQGRSMTFTKTYNQAGVGDGSGRAVTYGYAGNKLTSFVDGAHQTTQYTYDASTRINSIIDPNGNTYTIGYDTIGRVTAIADPGGSCTTMPTTKCTTFAYTDPTVPGSTGGTGMLGTTVVTDPLGHSTTFTWDNRDRVIKVTDSLGHAQARTYGVNDNQIDYTDQTSAVYSLAYDALGQNLTSTTSPASDGSHTAAVTSYSYAAGTFQPSSSADPSGNCTGYVYDASRNLTDSYAGQTGATCTTGGSTHNHLTYNTDGSIHTATDPKSNITTYTYTAHQLTSVAYPTPLGGQSLTYDTVGRVSSVTDGKSQKTTYGYDGDDRIATIEYNGTTTCTTANISAGTCNSYTYDNNGNIMQLQDNTGTTGFTWTTLNQPHVKTLPSTATITSTFDDAGNLATYADAGGTVTYGYNSADQLTSVADTTGTTTITPDSKGRRTSVAYPNGVTLSYGYTNAGLMKSFSAAKTGVSSLPNLTYSYVNAGNTADTALLSKIVDSTNSNTTTLGYDTNRRLTSYNQSASTNYAYAYDANGNVTTNTAGATSTYKLYNSANEQCWSGTTNGASCGTTPTGDYSFTYDGDGNETATSNGFAFAYNVKNQTTSITHPGNAAVAMTYADASSDQRTAAGTTTFVNGILGVTAATTAGSSTYYTRGPDGTLIDEHGASGTNFYLPDRLGSTLELSAASTGAISASYSYDPYGNDAGISGTAAAANPYRYASGYFDIQGDSEYKFGTRYYDRGGDWTQQDSVGASLANPAAVDRYAYVGSNPTNATDPSGRFSLCQMEGFCDFTAGLRDLFRSAELLGIGCGTAVQVGTIFAPFLSDNPGGVVVDCAAGAAGLVVGYYEFG